ncbi:hypothetical protein BVY03_01990 [bacterium K02(2017)]|nr:hypothetical protein BVY03_01990 [bacterium K02(2017)]
MLIPALKLKSSILNTIIKIVGENGVSVNELDRFSYSRDANTRSNIEAHYAHFKNFPKIITWPKTNQQLANLIQVAAENNIPITTFGGGSSICGGATPTDKSLVIDTKRLNKIIRLDTDKLYVEVESGIMALELEKYLQRHGYTLGHFPSSILCATLGGFLATRSAGQYSSKYGKIEDMIIDLEFVDGTGTIRQTSDVSRTRGFDLTQCIVGTEGTLGIITKAKLKIYHQPSKKIFQAYIFDNFENGIESLRRIMQTGIKPDALRLYDEYETALVLSKISKRTVDEERLASTMPDFFIQNLKSFKSSAFNLLFKSHRLLTQFLSLAWTRCALITVLEGSEKIIQPQLEIISNVCENLNAINIGTNIATHWHKHRYSVSFEGAKLIQDGAFVDTMEVATTWDNIDHLYHGVKRSLNPYCIVLAHVAHIYPDGAAIYFTMISPLSGLRRSVKKYDSIWQHALKAVQDYGGVLSHHHGIGRLKKDYIKKEWGEAHTLYHNLKHYFDPNKILNPGVLAN